LPGENAGVSLFVVTTLSLPIQDDEKMNFCKCSSSSLFYPRLNKNEFSRLRLKACEIERMLNVSGSANLFLSNEGRMAKKTALIMSGGGAKGAFQTGAEKYAREEKGYTWDIIAGVSVGALNGAMLAMEKYQRLWEIWNTLGNDQVFTGGFNLWSAIKVAFGAKSFYGNEPLWKKLQAELDPDLVKADLRIGTVSLVTGEYVQFDKAEKQLAKAVLASTVMPIVWTPVDISDAYPCMVDGGVRNITPVGDVLSADPDEIVIINCSPEAEPILIVPPKNLLDIGLRTMDIMLNEVFCNDVQNFLRINQLVKEAASYGITLHNPKDGSPLKYYECKLIEPGSALDDTLDFSQTAIQRSIQAGYKCAQAALG
jgi:NTE family protein